MFIFATERKTNKQRNKQTDGQTDRSKTIFPRISDHGGIKIEGGSNFYGGSFFNVREAVELLPWTGFLRSKNDPPCRRILTGGHFSP